MGRSTVKGYWRANANSVIATPAVLPMILGLYDLDATVDAGTLTGGWIPKGGVVMSIGVYGGEATGGTAPLLDVGHIGEGGGSLDVNGFADAIPFDASSTTPLGHTDAGSAQGVVLPLDLEIVYGDDGSGTNNTGGTVHIFVHYVMFDDGSFNN